MATTTNDKTIVIKRSFVPAGLPNDINLNRKRVFHKTLERFTEELGKAITLFPYIAEPYCIILKDIREGVYHNTIESKRELASRVNEEICNDAELIAYIENTIEDEYDLNIESESNKGKETAIMFTNMHAKRILCASMMSRIVFPLLSEFMVTHALRKEDELFLEMVNHIFQYFNHDPETGEVLDLVAKIQRYAVITTQSTLYSDKVIWKYLSNAAINEYTLAVEIARDLLGNILPKLETERSIISLFHVVAKNKVEYQFTSKFRVSYSPIVQIKPNADGVSPFTKIEQRLVKTNDELTISMMKLDVKCFIEDNCTLSDDDLIYHENNLVIHTGQTRILNFFISKFVGKGLPVLSLSKREYVRLTFIAKNWFEESNYDFISFILLGAPIPKHTTKRNFARGRSLLEITESSVFKRIKKKFTFMQDKVSDEMIISFIGDIINTDFELYTLPDGTQYAPTAAGNIKSAMVELLTFIETL